MYLDASGLSKAREAAFSFLLHSLRGCVEERRAEKGVKWNSPISPPEFLQSLAGNFSTEGKFAVEPTQTLERPPKGAHATFKTSPARTSADGTVYFEAWEIQS